MFAEACEIAANFTRPVVISRRDQNGRCSAGIGTFVVVNKEGWTVTAYHIVEEAEKLAQAAQSFQSIDAAKAAIYANTQLDKKERAKQLKALTKFEPESPTNTSAWWSWDKVRPDNFVCLPIVDLAFARIENFDPAMVAKYPVFKDPTKPMQQGRSLCRLGFPFHTIQPVLTLVVMLLSFPLARSPYHFFRLMEFLPGQSKLQTTRAQRSRSR